MKVVGRRFWTWMSVWALSLFVKGDLFALPQEKATTQVTDGTSNTQHKVPLLKTQSTAKHGSLNNRTRGLKTEAFDSYSKVPNKNGVSSDKVLDKTSSKPGISGGSDNPTESYKTKSKPHAHKKPK